MLKTKSRKQSLRTLLTSWLGHQTFFRLSLLGFSLSAGWIALSARFPMAFDEGYHLGIIQLYAKQWSPFFSTQPPNAAMYGALTRDPSYLYHYLMSFPYRLLVHLNHSFMTQVIALRFLNVLFLAVGLVLMRRVLLHTKASPALVNVAMLFIMIIPVTPLLGAHINYDNLEIMLTALALLLAMRFTKELKHEPNFPLGMLVGTVSFSMLACLVKFTFLPILAAIGVYIAFEIWSTRDDGLRRKFRRAVRHMGPKPMAAWLVLLAISFGLFFNTYGINLIKYHNPIPQCNQVLSVAKCSAYAPWARNYADALYNKGVNPNPLRFTASWFYGMYTRLFFTINGPGNPNSNENHIAPVLAITGVVIAAGGFILFAIYSKRLLKHDPLFGFLLFVTLVYCAALWGRNYHDYLHLGKMVAINGRYLIPVLFPVVLAMALGYRELLKKVGDLKWALLGIVLLLSLSGGGVLSYIHYSNDTWYWPQDQFVLDWNHKFQKIIKPFFL